MNIKEMNLWQKLHAITEKAEAIPKNGYNDYSRYAYVKASDVLEYVGKLLVDFRVTCIIKEESLERESAGKNFHTVLKCVGEFKNIDKPEEVEAVPFFGVAADTLDKDVYKAKTGGLKYLFTETFKIPTADLIDPEDTKHEPKPSFNKKSDAPAATKSDNEGFKTRTEPATTKRSGSFR